MLVTLVGKLSDVEKIFLIRYFTVNLQIVKNKCSYVLYNVRYVKVVITLILIKPIYISKIISIDKRYHRPCSNINVTIKMYVKVIFYEEMFGNKNVKVKLA